MDLEETILHLRDLIGKHDFECEECKRDHEELLAFLEELEQRRQLAADVAPVVQGLWLDGRCTVCGWEEPDEIGYDGYEFSPWEHTNYCPNCGTNMDGDADHA